jgi:predicted nucleic acid-binding protein
MKTCLFDASSIMLLAKRHPATASATLEGEYRLDLTMYEVGNAIWKVNKLINKSDKSTAMESMKQAYHLTALMETIRVEDLLEFTGTMEIAFDGSISFYDSAYLHTARGRGLTLVTEDEHLRRRAIGLGVNCVTSRDIESENRRIT